MPFDVAQLHALFNIGVILLVLLVWGVALLAVGNKGGPVERPNRIPQLYGYTVCLIAVVTSLLTVPNIVDSIFKLSNPLQTESLFGSDPALSSFEEYRATYRRAQESPFPSVEATPPPQAPTEAELRQQYEALRNERMVRNSFDARRSLVRSGFLLLVALGLFGAHWKWLRRLGGFSSKEAE
jgi:hypothetical protein